MPLTEMQASSTASAPSPIPLPLMAEECDDTTSFSSMEDDSETTHEPGSELRTLATRGTDNHLQESSTCRDGLKSRMSTTSQQADLPDERDRVEEPKVIWTKSRKKSLQWFLIIHFVPVATTVGLFALYLKGFRWNATDVQLKALLFAAKLHESLIVISLGDIIFHRIRYHLLTERGVSFGLLMSSFRVANPFYLLQPPFLASATFTLKSGPELLTILLVVLVSVLALLAAPSSAALMLPKYDWWQVPNEDYGTTNFNEQNPEVATYIGTRFENLFPLTISGALAPDPAKDDRFGIFSLTDRLQQIISGLDRVLVRGSLQADANITVVDGSTVDSFTLAYQEHTSSDCDFERSQDGSKMHDSPLDSSCRSVAVQATSPLAIVTRKLFDRYRIWMSASSEMFMVTALALDSEERRLTWRQPSVSMECSPVSHDGPDKLSVSYRSSFSPFSISADGQLLKEIQNVEAGGKDLATYIDITRLIPAEVTASTALLMYRSYDLGTINVTYICPIDARWIESSIWFTAPYSTIMRSGVSLAYLKATTGSNTTTTATSPVINITTGYANSLETRLDILTNSMSYYGQTTQYSPFEFIESYCWNRVGTALGPKCTMLAHALYLTDSLRRTQSIFGYNAVMEPRGSENLTLLTQLNWTKLDYQRYHQLHAYEFEGSIVKFSMSVLLVHMMLVYAHLLLLVFGDGWCSRAWTELGELMALAILTRPSPLLQNAGGGVNNWQTWKLRTFVREVTPEGRLELVLRKPKGSPTMLKKLGKGQDKFLVEPEANRRYG